MRVVWEYKREKRWEKNSYHLWDKTKDIIDDEFINDGIVIKDEVFPNRIFYLE